MTGHLSTNQAEEPIKASKTKQNKNPSRSSGPCCQIMSGESSYNIQWSLIRSRY